MRLRVELPTPQIPYLSSEVKRPLLHVCKLKEIRELLPRRQPEG
jgi:hypothetical protein